MDCVTNTVVIITFTWAFLSWESNNLKKSLIAPNSARVPSFQRHSSQPLFLNLSIWKMSVGELWELKSTNLLLLWLRNHDLHCSFILYIFSVFAPLSAASFFFFWNYYSFYLRNNHTSFKYWRKVYACSFMPSLLTAPQIWNQFLRSLLSYSVLSCLWIEYDGWIKRNSNASMNSSPHAI